LPRSYLSSGRSYSSSSETCRPESSTSIPSNNKPAGAIVAAITLVSWLPYSKIMVHNDKKYIYFVLFTGKYHVNNPNLMSRLLINFIKKQTYTIKPSTFTPKVAQIFTIKTLNI
jgi:hypothetical protein